MIAPLKDTSLQGYQFAFAHTRFTKVLRLARLKTPGTPQAFSYNNKGSLVKAPREIAYLT